MAANPFGAHQAGPKWPAARPVHHCDRARRGLQIVAGILPSLRAVMHRGCWDARAGSRILPNRRLMNSIIDRLIICSSSNLQISGPSWRRAAFLRRLAASGQRFRWRLLEAASPFGVASVVAA